jgi:hypothetical protein
MSKILVQQNDFRYGELDKFIISKYDTQTTSQLYARSGMAYLQNFFVNKYGTLSRRYGTKFIAEVKDSSKKTRLIPFSIGVQESYVIELGSGYIRIYSENGIEKNQSGTIIELATPYAEDDIDTIYNWRKGGSILYIVHPKYAPYELVRQKKTGYNIWTFQKVKFKLQLDSFNRPIYSGTPTTTSRWQQATGSRMELILETQDSTTFTGILTNGSNVITTSANYFTDAMVGQFISGHGIPAGVSIVSIVDAKTALMAGNATVDKSQTITKNNDVITSNNQNNYTFQKGVIYRLTYIGASGLNANQMRVAYIKTSSTGNSVYYQQIGGKITEAGDEAGVPKKTPLPLWEIEYGYDDAEFPSCICVSDQRLFLGSGGEIAGSRLTDYSDFGIYEDSVSATSPLKVGVYRDNFNNFNWLVDNDTVMYAGTDAEVFRLVKSQSSADNSINLAANALLQETGSAKLPPVMVGSYFLFLERNGVRFRAAVYKSSDSMMQSAELTETNRQILVEGTKRIVYQTNPNNLIMFVKKNGEVAVCGFTTASGVYYGGWARIKMDNGLIEDACVIPSSSTGRDDVYYLVNRTINGQTKRYIERYNDKTLLSEIHQPSNFLDCSLTVNTPFTTREVDGRKQIGGFNRLSGAEVYVVFNNNDIRSKRTITTDGYIQLEQIEETNFDNITSITCGLSYETKATIPPIEIFFDGRYSSRGEPIRAVDIKVMYQNSILCDIYNRLDKLEMEGKSFSNSDVLETQDAFVFEYKTNINGTKTKRNTYFTLKVRDSIPLPCNIMGIEYYTEI